MYRKSNFAVGYVWPEGRINSTDWKQFITEEANFWRHLLRCYLSRHASAFITTIEEERA